MRGFRVFDTAEKKYPKNEFRVNQDGILFVLTCHKGYVKADPSRYIVEESTGFKDKNDKMIFEGDIRIDGKGQYGVVFYSAENMGFLVNWKLEDGSYQTDDDLYESTGKNYSR